MKIFALLALLLASPAFAYDVTATMPTTAGATSCQLYLGGTAVGTTKPCGTAQSYPNLLTADGTYVFTYRTVNAAGQSVSASPARTVIIGTIPANPTGPPTIGITCTPSPCPSTLVITIN